MSLQVVSPMVMLQKELGADKEVYILDEPERSLGNEYINDVIVPLIGTCACRKEGVHFNARCKYYCANPPLQPIYRCHGKSGIKLCFCNPFTNNLESDDISDH